MIDIAPRNDEDEKKANVKETKPPAKRTYSRTAQKSKQSTRPKYKEVSTDADDDSEDEVVPNRISKPNPILSNKDFQPAPKTSKEPAKESDGEYDPEKDSE